MLEEFSKVPAWIREVKRSACRQGAMRAMEICRIYNPSIMLAQLVGGFPAMRVDGCKFVNEDYQQAVKETRVYATLIAEDINVEVFEPVYDEHDKRYPMSALVAISLKSSDSRTHPAGPSAQPLQVAPRPGIGGKSQIDRSVPGSTPKA